MNELEEKIRQFKEFLEIEHIHCTQSNLNDEAKTLEYVINEWNNIFQ